MAEMTDMQKDFLKELANIGLGHASTALSTMVNAKVDISLPSMSFISLENAIGMKTQSFCAVTTAIQGDLKGILLVTFADSASFWLIDKMSGKQLGTTKVYDNMGLEAMKEFVNIIGGAFLTSLSDFLKMDLMPKIPDIMIGRGTDITQKFGEVVKTEVNDILSVKTEIYVNEEKIEGELYLVLDKESFEKMFSKMI